jgi:ATP-dependent helicase/nuclease subunit B
VQARFILGPAGSGKTFRCLAEIRAALLAAPDGPPLLLLAPKQTTYQLERQLLADPALPGYARLRILSFERLAFFIFDELQKSPPRMLDEEGRLMVLRGLLAKKRDQLKLFRASARLTGFAQHLSLALRELQRQQLTPDSLAALAEQARAVEGLAFKLQDLATLLRDYLKWLADRNLQDAEHLLDFATETLRAPHPRIELGGLWVDGFTEMSPQELDLLAEILPQAPHAVITFCLDHVPTEKVSWLSHWSSVRQMFHRCRDRLARLPGCRVATELLPRDIVQGRFRDNPVLRHLEEYWDEPMAFPDQANVEQVVEKARPHPGPLPQERERSSRFRQREHPREIPLAAAIRVAACANPEAEATLAAREILRFVRAGGRYREVTVLARRLQNHHAALATIFGRYGIPVFLDRRESVSHHPLAELTRNAVRTVAYSWARDDWFAALKTGLVPGDDTEIDRLENEALARGWNGPVWQKPIAVPGDAELERWVEALRRKIVPPFNQLALRFAQHGNKPNGPQLAEALREFWETLDAEETLRRWSTESAEPQPVHLTVWEQMSAWLENVERAFPEESLTLREWLPILDAGLAGLSVGVIPPTLDQVLVGAIDRSRNPDIRLAIVLGMNETVFPAPPESSVLLTESDRVELEKQGVSLVNARQQLGREFFYGYIACTRARERVVLTWCQADAAGKTLNPSPFLGHLKRLFPALEFETVHGARDWRESEHAVEMIAPLLRSGRAAQLLDDLPALGALREQLRHLTVVPGLETLSPALAARLYGPELRTSVSRMEQFAACPFKFFVHSGLRAEERKLFELDIRNQGNFQHEVLAYFHIQLQKEGKRWRDLEPREARERIQTLAAGMAVSFRDGLLQATEETKFTARMLTESLQDFVETLIGWMRKQYSFDPAAVELPFGDESFPPWELELADGHRLKLHGRIDRIDLCKQDTADDTALCVVVDYKSSQKQLDPLLMQHGLQLQLPAYLNVLRHWPDPRGIFGVGRLIPEGVFYVNLRGKYERGANRDESLADVEETRKLAYQHTGRFDAQHLRLLDNRPDATEGDQFKYKLNKNGSISRVSREALDTEEFMALLDGVEDNLKRMGRAIYEGEAKVDPYRKGNVAACDQCDYRAICRIDPWTHIYRVLRREDGD